MVTNTCSPRERFLPLDMLRSVFFSAKTIAFLLTSSIVPKNIFSHPKTDSTDTTERVSHFRFAFLLQQFQIYPSHFSIQILQKICIYFEEFFLLFHVQDVFFCWSFNLWRIRNVSKHKKITAEILTLTTNGCHSIACFYRFSWNAESKR